MAGRVYILDMYNPGIYPLVICSLICLTHFVFLSSILNWFFSVSLFTFVLSIQHCWLASDMPQCPVILYIWIVLSFLWNEGCFFSVCISLWSAWKHILQFHFYIPMVKRVSVCTSGRFLSCESVIILFLLSGE